MDRCANVNRSVLVAFCGLLAATPVYANSEHKAKPASSHEDQDAILRHKLRDTINTGLVGIVSEGTDYTTDLALTLASEQNGLRLLPVAGAGALQNAEDVMFARGIDFCLLCRPTCSIKSSGIRLFRVSKNTCNTSRSCMIKTFMSSLDQTSSRSTIREGKKSISACVTAEPIRRQQLSSTPSGSSRM